MSNSPLELIDFAEVDRLLEGFNKSTGFVTAILDLEGNVLSKSGWRKICTGFHRINDETSKKCTISDTVLANKMAEGEKYHFYKCLNGLVDVAVPLRIKGEHVANLFSGQFFFEAPDPEFFRKQANEAGFDEKEYMEALQEVPIVNQEKVKASMDFLLDMTLLISELLTQKQEQAKLNRKLANSESRFRGLLTDMLVGCQIIGFDWKYIYINPEAEKHNQRPASGLLGRRYQDMWPGIENTFVFAKIKECLESNISVHFENEFIYPNGEVGWFDLRIQPIEEGAFIQSIDITENKKAQAAGKKQKELLESVINHLPAAVCVLNGKDLRVELINPAYQAIAPGKEMIGLTWDELWPETGRNFETICRNVLESGNSYQVIDEMNMVKRTPESPPEEAYFSWSLHRIQLPGKEDWGLLGTSWETTLQKRAELQVYESELQYRNLADAGLALIWTSGNDKLCNYFNKTWLEFTGRSLAQEQGYGWAEGVHPDDLERCKTIYETSFDWREPFEMEYRLRHNSGAYRYIYDMGTPNYNSKGEFIGYIGHCFDITERKEIESALRKSEERFRLVINNLSDIIVLINADGTQRYVSPVSEKITGFGATDQLGSTIADVIHPDDIQRLSETWSEMIKHPDRVYKIQYRYIHKTKGWVWLEANAQSFLDEPSINAVLLTARDITESKEAEKILKESEKKYRMLFNSNPHPMWVYDLETLSFLAVNDSAVNKYGYSRAEFMQMSIRDIRPKEDINRLLQNIEKSKNGLEESGVWRHVKKDGSIIFVEINSHFLEYEGRSAQVVLAHDITLRKQAEEKLQYQQQLISDMGRVAKIGGWEFDALTGKGTWTEETARIHDMDPADETNVEKGISFYKPESRIKIEKAIKNAIENALPYKLELQMVTATGVEKWVQTIGQPIVEEGKVIKVRGSFQDISQRKKAEEIIYKLNSELEEKVILRTAQLEASNKELEAFSYTVSHDLRAPLRHISGYIDLLNEHYKSELSEKANHYLSMVSTSARQMGLLIDDLLRFSRTSRQEMLVSQINFQALVGETITALASETTNRIVHWDIQTLPEVYGDPSMLRQVWFNLLENALKYSRKKEETKISIGCTTKDTSYEFFVRDNGVGFNMKYAHKLFGVFQRLHSAAEFEGTGIGLASVQRIIHKHNGTIRAESEPGTGTTFYFTIPIQNHES